MKSEKFESNYRRRLALKERIDASGTTAVKLVFEVALLFAGGFVAYLSGGVARAEIRWIVMVVILFVIVFAIAFILAFAFAVVTAKIAIENDKFIDLLLRFIDFIKNRKDEESKINIPSRYRLLKLCEILYSFKTQKEVFISVMADWDEEIYEALKKNKNANLFMINVRYTYAFLAAMWQKSPIGDLIEFVAKIAKG